MHSSAAFVLALFAAAAQAIPAPAPPTCNPNPHGRYCSFTMIGAAGVEVPVAFEIDFQTHPISMCTLLLTSAIQ